jgi:adenylate kinase
MTIKSVVAEFASRLTQLVESHAMDRARAAVMSAFGTPRRRGPGRPPKSASAPKQLAGKAAAPAKAKPKKARKKAPLQLCPVPGCKNPAAPVFGMVCSKHKDLPKAKIKKFREARKAKKLGLAAPSAKKTSKKTSKKAAPKKRAAKKAAPKKVAKAMKKAPAIVSAPVSPATMAAASATG